MINVINQKTKWIYLARLSIRAISSTAAIFTGEGEEEEKETAHNIKSN